MIQATEYTDIPVEGGFTTQGDIVILYGSQAISNALNYFLCGARPDLFDLSKQGIIRKFINRPLSLDTAVDMKVSITTAIELDFSPELIIHRLDLIPDYENQEWRIQLNATTKDTYTPVTLDERVFVKSKGVFNA